MLNAEIRFSRLHAGYVLQTPHHVAAAFGRAEFLCEETSDPKALLVVHERGGVVKAPHPFKPSHNVQADAEITATLCCTEFLCEETPDREALLVRSERFRVVTTHLFDVCHVIQADTDITAALECAHFGCEDKALLVFLERGSVGIERRRD